MVRRCRIQAPPLSRTDHNSDSCKCERPESLFFTPRIRIIDLPGVINDKYIYIYRMAVDKSTPALRIYRANIESAGAQTSGNAADVR